MIYTRTLNQITRKKDCMPYFIFVCYIALHYSCSPTGLDAIEELSVASNSTRGVEPGTEVDMAFAAELYVTEQ